MIKLSKKGSYALKAVIYIAKSDDRLVKIKDISQNEKISEALLRRIIADLERNNILDTIKGRIGGIKLAKKAELITIYDILYSVGEELGISDCTRGISCENIDTCSTTTLLGNLQRGFNSIMKLYTLDKVIKNDLGVIGDYTII